MEKSPFRRGDAAAEGVSFDEVLPRRNHPAGETLYFKDFSI